MADAHERVVRNLKHWMGIRDLTAAEVARRLEKNRSAISHWFANLSSPDMATIGALADILEVDILELFRERAEDGSLVERGGTVIPIDPELDRAVKIVVTRLGYEAPARRKRR